MPKWKQNQRRYRRQNNGLAWALVTAGALLGLAALVWIFAGLGGCVAAQATTSISPELRAEIDSEIEQRISAKLEAAVSAAVDAKLEAAVDAKISARIDPEIKAAVGVAVDQSAKTVSKTVTNDIWPIVIGQAAGLIAVGVVALVALGLFLKSAIKAFSYLRQKPVYEESRKAQANQT